MRDEHKAGVNELDIKMYARTKPGTGDWRLHVCTLAVPEE